MEFTDQNLATPSLLNQKTEFPGSEICARAYRSRILHSLSLEKMEYFLDGGLLVSAQGTIEACKEWTWLEQQGKLSGYEVVTLPPDALIIPGFVDLHVHLPQMEVTGCQEEDLLAWLNRYIFQAEACFRDETHARAISRWFFEELLRNGTTTAAVFLTSHDAATRIAFETAEKLGNRVVMGQNLMDINAPAELCKPAANMLSETEAHCQRWHGSDQGRIQYAWMPRFALTSSETMLQGLGDLRIRYPDVYLHTHLSEQPSEISAVLSQFPQALNYTGVYQQFGLLGPKTILAHGVHLTDSELDGLKDCHASLAHCPSSNFFLKSGRFRLLEILRRGLRMGLGSDVGAGPELSLFKTMKDAQYRQDDHWVPLANLFYSATLGGARALFQEDRFGNFLPGKEADFLILNEGRKLGLRLPAQNSSAACSEQTTLDNRSHQAEALISRLVYLGDDRLVQATFIRGRRLYGQIAEHEGKTA